MQGFPRGSLGKSFLSTEIRANNALISSERACRVFREATLSEEIPEALGKLITLHEKQHCVGWWWPSDRFDLAHTVGTQGIEPHTVLPGHQVFGELCL